MNNQNCSHLQHLAPQHSEGANEIFRGWPLQIGIQRSHPPFAFNFLFSEFSSPISIYVCDKYFSTLPARLATQGWGALSCQAPELLTTQPANLDPTQGRFPGGLYPAIPPLLEKTSPFGLSSVSNQRPCLSPNSSQTVLYPS